MKRSFYTIGSLIILLIAAFVFVLVPIFAGGAKASTLPPFGSYDGKDIRYEQDSDFANYIVRYADYFKEQNIEINDSNYYYIFNYAFNTTVMNMAQKDYVSRSGYIVPQSAINRQLRPYFNDETGKYSEKLYRAADPDKVISMMASIKESLIASRYSDDMFGRANAFGSNTFYGLKSCVAEEKAIASLNCEKRDFDLAVFNMDEYPDDEKKRYAETNKDLFDKFDFLVITYPTKEAAAGLATRIKNEEITFSDAVAESSKTYSDNDGKLINSYRYQLKTLVKDEAQLASLVGLGVDGVSEVIATGDSYSIFRCQSAPKALDTSNEDEIKTVYRYIVSNEYSVIENYFNEKAKTFAAIPNLGSTFKVAALDAGAKCLEVKDLPLNWGNLSVIDKIDTSIEGLTGADTNENLLKSIFSLNEGEVTAPITNGSNILVFHLKSITKSENALDSLSADKSVALDKATESESKEDKTSSSAAKTNKEEAGEGSEVQKKADEINKELASFDQAAFQEALFASPKLKNNLNEVYYKYIAGNKS